jgi:autonomous glycyl radical cofactor GrcA
MKRNFNATACTLAVCIITLAAFTRIPQHKWRQQATADSIITSGKWFAAEILVGPPDSNINTILMMQPCEKDNYIVFNTDKKYQLLEGEQKCSDNDAAVKAEGQWEYNAADSTFTDKFQGGKGISKKVLLLTGEVMKMEYIGEGNQVHTITFFSEKGKANQHNKELVSYTDDPGSNILQSIRKYLQSTNRYVMLSNDALQQGETVKADDKDGMLPTIVLAPFINDAEIKAGTTIAQRNNTLMAMGKKAGIDYIITGKLMDNSIDKKEGKFIGTVKYEISVIDIANQTAESKVFDGNSEKPAPVQRESGVKKWLRRIKNVTEKVKEIAPQAYNIIPLMALTNTNYLKMYNTFWDTYKTVGHINRVDNFFGSVNEILRKTSFDSTMSGLNAIASTEEETQAYLVNKAAVIIKINSIKGDGKNAEVTIEAGNNISLEAGEILNVMEVTRATLSDGTTQSIKKNIGKLKVKEVLSDKLSICSIEEKNRKEVIKRFKEAPQDIIVTTTADTTEK